MPTMRMILQRLLMFFVVIWIASTLNFFVPRITPRNPIEEKLLSQVEFGGSAVDIQSLLKAYNVKFGLDKPLLQQYIAYLSAVGNIGDTWRLEE